jgi:hypothetical protein
VVLKLHDRAREVLYMTRLTAIFLAATFVAVSVPADAQPRRGNSGDRQDAARAQGIPPGHLPPPSQCRVWYDRRPNGQQPPPTSCARAQAIASRDRDARVVYGEDVWRSGGRYSDRYGRDDVYDRDGRYDDRDDARYPDNDRAVPRGSVRDPRLGGSVSDRDVRQGGSIAFRNGYRDGMTKGREDVEDGDRYNVSRHSWYRSATRGYENRLGTRYEYIDRYRRGFEAGYDEGYRVYTRRR